MRRWLSGLMILLLLGATVASGLWVTRRAMLPSVGVDSPAMATLLVMLGGSRGLLAEVLWWRVTELQSAGRYAELVPLTELLVTLEPTSEDAWIYNAWNLAYNVSAAHTAPADRWEWVVRGVNLLERGLRIQPQSEALLQQMGWMWEDKIGGHLDAAAPYYRAHCGEIALPEDWGAFEARVGAKPDGALPVARALYWYDRAGVGLHQLRALTQLLNVTREVGLIPYYVQCVRSAWSDLSDLQRNAVVRFTTGLAAAHPQMRQLTDLLEEIER